MQIVACKQMFKIFQNYLYISRKLEFSWSLADLLMISSWQNTKDKILLSFY